jgi:hypothetical protein
MWGKALSTPMGMYNGTVGRGTQTAGALEALPSMAGSVNGCWLVGMFAGPVGCWKATAGAFKELPSAIGSSRGQWFVGMLTVATGP